MRPSYQCARQAGSPTQRRPPFTHPTQQRSIPPIYLARANPRLLQDLGVLVKRPLQRQHPDEGLLLLLTAAVCSC